MPSRKWSAYTKYDLSFKLTCINVESNLNLRDTLWGRGNTTNEVEVTEDDPVIPNQLTFTLEDLDLDSCLTVSRSRECCLQLLGRNGGIAVDKDLTLTQEYRTSATHGNAVLGRKTGPDEESGWSCKINTTGTGNHKH